MSRRASRFIKCSILQRDSALNRALCYVANDSEDAVRALPWPEREAQLL